MIGPGIVEHGQTSPFLRLLQRTRLRGSARAIRCPTPQSLVDGFGILGSTGSTGSSGSVSRGRAWTRGLGWVVVHPAEPLL